MSPHLSDVFNQGFQYLRSTLIWLAFLIPIASTALFGGFLVKWTNNVDRIHKNTALTVAFRIAAIVLWTGCFMYLLVSIHGLNEYEVWMACILAYVQCITPAIAGLVVLGMGYFAWVGVTKLPRRTSSREDV